MALLRGASKVANFAFFTREVHALCRASRAGKAKCKVGPLSEEKACCAASACFENVIRY